MTDKEINELTDRIKVDDEFLMYVAGKLVEYDRARHNGTFKNPAFKPVWKGSIDFLDNVGKWWESKKYLSIKQKDAVVKVIDKNLDRVVLIWDLLTDDVITGSNSEIAYFGVEEFDGNCPFCGNKLPAANSLIVDGTYICDKCKQTIEYIKDEPPTISNSNKITTKSNDDIVDQFVKYVNRPDMITAYKQLIDLLDKTMDSKNKK